MGEVRLSSQPISDFRDNWRKFEKKLYAIADYIDETGLDYRLDREEIVRLEIDYKVDLSCDIDISQNDLLETLANEGGAVRIKLWMMCELFSDEVRELYYTVMRRYYRTIKHHVEQNVYNFDYFKISAPGEIKTVQDGACLTLEFTVMFNFDGILDVF